MKKSKYDISYFLSNQYFVDWVRHPRQESEEFWDNWLRNHPESQSSFQLAKGILEKMEFGGDPDIGKRKEDILGQVLKDQPSAYFNEGQGKQWGFSRVLPWGFRLIAASVLVILAATFILSSFPVTSLYQESTPIAFVVKKNPKGQKSAFYLPDKTQVVLNAGSKISYPESFGKKNREVFLEGEAYFDVTHDQDKKFLVHAGEVVTQVHGTSFIVSAYNNEQVNIALERGLVSVYPLDTKEPVIPQYIKPGEMIAVRQEFEHSVKSTYDYEQQFGWKEGKLVFRGTNMPTLVKTLERWYGVEITVVGKPSEDWKVSGVFHNESLKNVLEGVKYARNISYQIHGHNVIINIQP
ncbi:hypothetical protein DN752_23625 [Echinicola strongylocentroti]|uniref:Iron dicitrate transport regulator FecR n=1 Tax=Echinicola strongylocentroti TaxID=1795355 RepID=A0A2Z4IQH4_9BACT|nr:FecR domain-containing protein [Echinicola strongylocentroti]AWW32888.1 hypothetical protein DN752_23625 [Echinicola strongylocentroti]